MTETSFEAPVVYVQPSFEELKQQFSPDVFSDFKSVMFEPIDRCKRVRRVKRKIRFEVIDMVRDSDVVLDTMKKRILRPALYEEMLAFHAKYPEVLDSSPIVALGSEADVRGIRYVACMWRDRRGRHLALDWIGRSWLCGYRALAVRLVPRKAARP